MAANNAKIPQLLRPKGPTDAEGRERAREARGYFANMKFDARADLYKAFESGDALAAEMIVSVLTGPVPLLALDAQALPDIWNRLARQVHADQLAVLQMCGEDEQRAAIGLAALHDIVARSSERFAVTS